MTDIKIGYDNGFVVASARERSLDIDELPYQLRVNGWGQLRLTRFESDGEALDLNQFQLVRGRLILSGNAFSPNFDYFVQLDGRSSSGDTVRLLDYFMDFDLGRHAWHWDKGTLGLRVGRYKMPFTFARFLSAKEFEFTDRSVASTYFDINRSLGAAHLAHCLRGKSPFIGKRRSSMVSSRGGPRRVAPEISTTILPFPDDCSSFLLANGERGHSPISMCMRNWQLGADWGWRPRPLTATGTRNLDPSGW